MLRELSFVKWVRIFLAKLFCKMSGLFYYLFWLWKFLPENLKLIDKLQIWGLESFIFWPKFDILGTVLRLFSQRNFKTFCLRPNMVTKIFTHGPLPSAPLPPPLHHKNASYDADGITANYCIICRTHKINRYKNAMANCKNNFLI